MSLRDDGTRLAHMLSHAEEAVAMAQGRTDADLYSDRMLSLALVRLLEIIGEAASRVSPETRENLAAIPWPDVISLRNRLIHGYDNVDLAILWDIIELDLPPLVAELRKARS